MRSKIGEFKLSSPSYDMMVKPMKEKLRKYFKEIPPVITCAVALNPCFNISGVKLFIEKIFIDLDSHEENLDFSTNAKAYFNKYFKDLFDIYFNKYGSPNVSTSSAPSSSSTSSKFSLSHTLRQESVKRVRSDQTGTNEFGRYTITDWISALGQEEFESFDILSWWKARKSQFPVLAIMARDLLSVQASTVASESAFFLCGRVLSIRRTRLTPAYLEMCICLKDHLDAQERIQDILNLEGDCLEVEQQLLDVDVDAEAGYTISLSDEEIALDEQARSGFGDSEEDLTI
ncbi:zinc finger BED domain-containing protein RICESLEEPER 2 [Tanacetum coccineum]